jgi:competence ComEA-like helix-hairpin-helix protein
MGEERKVRNLHMDILKFVFIVFALMMFLPTAGVLAQDGVLNLNKASVDELLANEDLELDKEIATAIVNYREKNGAFKKPKDLLNVPGMDEDLFDEINPVMQDGDLIYDPDSDQPGMNAY